MQWQGICEFAAVAETASFTKAAKKLKLSTAQVSRQINALEKRLEIKLFYRTTRQVALTDDGRIFYQHCRVALDGLENAEQAINQLHTQLTGKIKMTAPVNYGELNLVPLINNFLLEYPQLEVQLELTNTRLDLVDNGIDLAIRLGSLDNSSLMARQLVNRKLYLCASPDYLAQNGTPQLIDDLHQHNCLLGTLDYWRFEQNGKIYNIKVNGRLRCNSGFGLLDAALKHIGIVQLPDYYVQDYINDGSLISLLADYQKADDGIWAVYPNNRHLSNKVRVLVDYLQQHLTGVS